VDRQPPAQRASLLVACLLYCLLLGGSFADRALAGYKRCGGVALPGGSLDKHTKTEEVFASGTDCRTARRVARIYLREREARGRTVRPLGFRCSGGADGVACRKGKRRVTWGYYFD